MNNNTALACIILVVAGALVASEWIQATTPKPAIIAIVGNESKRIPLRVTREAFVLCVENLDPDSLELARQIEACAGVDR